MDVPEVPMQDTTPFTVVAVFYTILINDQGNSNHLRNL